MVVVSEGILILEGLRVAHPPAGPLARMFRLQNRRHDLTTQ